MKKKISTEKGRHILPRGLQVEYIELDIVVKFPFSNRKKTEGKMNNFFSTRTFFFKRM